MAVKKTLRKIITAVLALALFLLPAAGIAETEAA